MFHVRFLRHAAAAAFALGLCAAGVATAQDKSAGLAAPAKDASAAADQLIAESGLGDVFENVSGPGDDMMTIRHRASGMGCYMRPGPRNRLTNREDMPRGDDVTCKTDGSGLTMIFRARRVGPSMTAEQASSSIMAQIQTDYPDMKPYDRELTTVVRKPGQPTVIVNRFTSANKGAPMFANMSFFVLNGWMIELIVVTGADNVKNGVELSDAGMDYQTSVMMGAKP